MRRRWLAILLAGVVGAGPAVALGAPRAQEPAEKEPEAKTTTHEESAKKQEPVHSLYRVDYVVREIEHGKTSNTRKYTLTAEEHKSSSFRVGSRIPLATGKE